MSVDYNPLIIAGSMMGLLRLRMLLFVKRAAIEDEGLMRRDL